MKPLNIQERQKAFQRFLLFFILTVAVIVTAIFFGVKIPYAENEKLQEQLSIVDKENRFREDFSRAMAEAQSLLDTVNMDPVGDAAAVSLNERQVRIFFAKPKPGYRFAGVGVDGAQTSGGVSTDGGKSRAAVGDLNNMNATQVSKKLP